MSEGSLGQPPHDEQEHPQRNAPDQDLAEGLLGQLPQGTAGTGVLALIAERELNGEPGEQEVNHAVGDQTRSRRVAEPVALLRAAAHHLGVVQETSSSLNHDSRT
jgi:hypothetical protein